MRKDEETEELFKVFVSSIKTALSRVEELKSNRNNSVLNVYFHSTLDVRCSMFIFKIFLYKSNVQHRIMNGKDKETEIIQ